MRGSASRFQELLKPGIALACHACSNVTFRPAAAAAIPLPACLHKSHQPGNIGSVNTVPRPIKAPNPRTPTQRQPFRVISLKILPNVAFRYPLQVPELYALILLLGPCAAVCHCLQCVSPLSSHAVQSVPLSRTQRSQNRPLGGQRPIPSMSNPKCPTRYRTTRARIGLHIHNHRQRYNHPAQCCTRIHST